MSDAPVAKNSGCGRDEINHFVQLLSQSGLLARDEIARILQEYRQEILADTEMPDGITALCTFLVGRRVLTTWQCAKLHESRHKGFLLDEYVLLDKLRGECDGQVYFARSREDGKYVNLLVTPPGDFAAQGIQYRVMP